MRPFLNAVMAVTLATACGAVLLQRDEPLDRLRGRSAASAGGERAKLFSELARRQMEMANDQFTAGAVEEGHKLVQQSLGDAETAVEAARTSGKRLKETEIELRRLARRTEDIRRSLNFEDRPVLAKAVERLEDLRRKLLEKMFKKEK